MIRWRFLVLLTLILFVPFAHADILLNEEMSSNGGVILDEDGAASDWIELYNNGTASFDLDGYYLTDSAGTKTKWRFPAVTVDSHEFLLVWASSKNRTTPGAPLHTNFAISAGGEPIILTAPDGTTAVDSFPSIALASNQSYGRVTDGGLPVAILAAPTPNATNTIPVLPLALTLSAPAGVHPSAFNLTITTNRNATIRYTLDGSVPNGTSPVYTGPLQITDNADVPNTLSMINETSPAWKPPIGNVRKATVLRAYATDGNESTAVKTATYLVGASYTLPIVSVTTEQANLFDYYNGIYLKGVVWDQAEADGWQGTSTFHPANYREEWERPVHLEMFEANGTRVIDQDVGMQISGQGSRRREQKSLRFYARSDYGKSSIAYRVFTDQPSITSYRRLTLRNPDDDERTTFLRDVLAQQLARAMGGVASEDYRPVVAFLDGEYWGLYPLREKANQHYLESHYGVNKDEVVILEDNALIDEGQPGDEQPYLDMVEYARAHDLRDPTNYAYMQERMDTESFLRYYLLETYVGNTDWPSRNVVFWRLKTNVTNTTGLPYGHDGKWRWVLHDADYAFAYMPNQGPDYDMFEHIDRTTWGGALWRALARNEEFRDEFATAAAQELSSTFEPSNAIPIIDTLSAGIAAEVPEQANRWTGLNGTDQWLSNLDLLREYLQERPDQYRAHLVRYFGLGGTIDLTVTGDSTRGGVLVNSQTADLPLTRTYFQDVPITLSAEAAPGKSFLGWTGAASGTDPTIAIVLSEDATIGALFADSPGPAPAGADAWITRKWPATHMAFNEGSSELLLLEIANPAGAPIDTAWSVDHVPIAASGLSLDPSGLAAGNHTIEITVTVGATVLRSEWDVAVSSIAGTVCYANISSLPASCVGGTILPGDDTVAGSCRTVTCTSASGSKRIFACEKPSSQNPVWFEMYKQATTDQSLRVCLASTCIGSNGFAQTNFADACVTTNITRDISFLSTTPASAAVTLVHDGNLTFSYAVSNPAGLPVGSLWLLDGAVLPLQEDLTSYEFHAQSSGAYNLSVIVSSNETSIQRDWLVTVLNETGNGTGNQTNSTTNQTNTTVLTVSLAPAPWFPQGRNVVWKCIAAGGNGTYTYKFLFGDGQQGPNEYLQDNIWHTYGANGTYNATCTVTDTLGHTGAGSSIVTLGTVPPAGNGTGNQTNVTQNISFTSTSPAGTSIAISEPSGQAFSYVLQNPSGLATTTAWTLDGVPAGSGAAYAFVGGYDTAGVHTVNLTVASSQNTLMRSWTLTVTDVDPGNTTATATLAFAPWFPQGLNAVLVCTADGFTPTAYEFVFGDGTRGPSDYAQNNMWHTYAAPGSYAASCVARNGATSATGNLQVVVA